MLGVGRDARANPGTAPNRQRRVSIWIMADIATGLSQGMIPALHIDTVANHDFIANLQSTNCRDRRISADENSLADADGSRGCSAGSGRDQAFFAKLAKRKSPVASPVLRPIPLVQCEIGARVRRLVCL